MNPDNWESVDSIDTSSGVMVSNLPLLFASGNITSLQHMSLTELEVFLPFMVRCSAGEDLKLAWSQLPKPLWWPSRLPFRPPSCPTPTTTKTLMVRLIERCYAFHGCQYLLHFCLSLRQMEPSVGYRFTDNRDGTTSMYHGSTGKLLVTFRNENKDYDKAALKPKNQLSSQKKLLPSPSLQSSTKNGIMVRPPISDVFLCDKCDDEFSSLREVQTHEKNCKGNSPQMMKLPSPEPEYPEEEHESEDQVPFLSYFGLQPEEHTGIAPYKSPRKRQPPPVKKPLIQSYLRFDSIDIASPLGKYILSNCKYGGKLQMPQQQVLRYERYVFASPEPDQVSTREMRERSANRWIVVWRPRRDEQPWVHLYTFTSDQRRERLVTLQTGLDKRSRKLLTKCKPARVKLKRLAKRTIDRATRLGGRSAPCIDLTSEDDPSCAPRFVPASAFSNDAHTVVPVPFPPHENTDIASRDPLSLDTFNNSSAYSDQWSFTSSETGLSQTQVDPYENNLLSRVPTIENGNCLSVHEHDMNTEFNLKKLTSYGVKVSNICSDSLPENRLNSCLDSVNLSVNKNHYLGMLNNDSLVNNTKSSHCSSPSSILPKVPSIRSPVGAEIPAASLVKGPPYHAVYITESSSPTKAIEVIDLSSDEEDASKNGELSNVIGRSDYPPVGHDSANRSHARSKNGYSHWSSDECSKRGRDQSYSMTNGTTPRSVPPQPSTDSHCCSPLSPHFNISAPLEGQTVSLPLSSYLADISRNQPMNTHSYARSFFHMTENHDGAFHGSEVVPSSIKVPLQIDEDISFNFRMRDPPSEKESPEMCGRAEDSTTQSYSNNLLFKIADKVNKGLIYFTSFVTSNIYNNLKDVFESYIEIGLEDIKNPMLLKAGNSRTKAETLSRPKEHQTKKLKTSREIQRLQKDECRELKRRGIGVLDYLEDSRKQNQKMTRCAAEREMANLKSLTTRRNKFITLPARKVCPKKERSIPKENTSAENRGTIKRKKRKDYVHEMDHKAQCDGMNHETHSDVKVTPQQLLDESFRTSAKDAQVSLREKSESPTKESSSVSSQWWSVDENFNEEKVRMKKPDLNSKKYKRPKLKRELASLVHDECKELKDLGFHPSDILGSFQSSDEEEVVATPNVKRRISLISFKGNSEKNRNIHNSSRVPFDCGQSVKSLAQGNKRLSLELSKLMMDEWKELRSCGSHPSQLTGLLSIRRSARSNAPKGCEREPACVYEQNDDDLSCFSLARSSRAQERMAASVEVQNPRKSHREMIRTENGMCVLNYTLANIM